MTKTVNVAVVGAGLVGSAFLNQIAHVKVAKLNVIAIARLSGTIISKDYEPLDLSNWTERLAKAPETRGIKLDELVEYLKNSPLPVVLVDNTSDQTIAQSYPVFLDNGISVATPNKKAFSSDISLWDGLFESAVKGNALVYHESTVGAGLPIISTLKDLVATGDEVYKIEGIVSGTLSYIFNNFSIPESGTPKKFSEIVLKAKNLGYTEPDPRDDLNGLDVARKLTILARLAGLRVKSATSFPVESLIPKPLEKVGSASEFLQRLGDFDGDIEKQRIDAASNGQVLRYSGQIDLTLKKNQVTVGLRGYPKNHPFATLTGSDNVIAFYTKRYGNNPLIIQGAGAGDQVTAMGVLGDVIKIASQVGRDIQE